jgi:hypothetical protein
MAEQPSYLVQPYTVAEIGEELLYETVFVRWFGEINEDAVEWAKEEIKRYECSEGGIRKVDELKRRLNCFLTW